MESEKIKIFQILNLLIFTLTVFSLILTPPVKSFELSIYELNPLFWITATLTLVLNFFILLEMSLRQLTHRLMLFISLIQLLIVKVLIVSFWALRYPYILIRGDQATYLGHVVDILQHGTFFDNFYPYMSVLISTLGYSTGLPPYDIAKLIPGLFQLIGFLGIFLLARFFFGESNLIAISMAFAIPFIFNWFPATIYPHMTSVYFAPLVLYFILRSVYQNRKKLICVVYILILPLVFWHPFTTITLLIFLYIMCIQDRKFLPISIFFSVIFLLWLVNSQHLLYTTKITIERMFSEFKITTFDIAESYMEKLGLFDSLRIFLLLSFDDIVFYFITLLLLLYLVKEVLKYTQLKFNPLPIYIWFVVSNFLIACLMFETRGHVPDRLINLNWSLLFSPLLGAFIFLNKPKVRKLLIFLVLFSIVISIYTLYPSPIINRPNECSLHSEVSGANWIISKTKEELKFAYILTPIGRYSDLIYGTKVEGKSRFHIGYYKGESYFLPSHFNLTEFDRELLGNRIFILTEYERLSYGTIWKKVDRFDQDDFKLLNIDFASNAIYNNGHFESYLVDFKYFNIDFNRR